MPPELLPVLLIPLIVGTGIGVLQLALDAIPTWFAEWKATAMNMPPVNAERYSDGHHASRTVPEPELSFTNDCNGDLGIRVGDRLVAQLFHRRGDLIAVYDLVKEGEHQNFATLAEGIRALTWLAEQHARCRV